MRALVVPTNRPESINQFLIAWKELSCWDETFIVWDGPRQTMPSLPRQVRHLTWDDVDKSPNPEIFSRCDSAIRSFGFYEAYKAGAELVLTLDDDCFPDEQHDISEHFRILSEGVPTYSSTVDNLRVRGLPYCKCPYKIRPDVNIGLWTGVPDLDAITQISQPGASGYLCNNSRIIHPSIRVPMCGMNLAFTRDVLPYMYFPLMGKFSPYRRFDDIWAGILVQSVMQYHNHTLSVGPPFVHHLRASDPYKNLRSETPGIAPNDLFWEAVYHPNPTLSDAINKVSDNVFEESYLQQLKDCISKWENLF